MEITQKHCLALFLVGLCVILLSYPLADYLVQVMTYYDSTIDIAMRSELTATLRTFGGVIALVFGYGLLRKPPQDMERNDTK